MAGMILTHRGKSPTIHPEAYVAPTATVCGDVRLAAGCRIMHGAALVAEEGGIEVGSDGIVLENAVIRATGGHPVRIGRHCLVGPQAHLVGCVLEDEVFVATGAAIFHGARLGRGAEVRIHGVVHLQTVLAAGAVVPIGWVAVGDPAQIFPPHEHEKIWAVQKPLNFPLTAYGIDRAEADMIKITQLMSARLAGHASDEVAPAL
jgi:carbonic anhydrase/acetyltransferase-like protein (isoleucine patch superfamily)